MTKILKSFAFRWLAIVLCIFALKAPPALAADEPVVLTIAGEIKTTNRNAFDPQKDGFLNYHEKTFTRAFELTLKDLMALPQHEITALGSADSWRGPVRLKGPRLKDVLALAGTGDHPVTLFALDGYGAKLDRKLLDSKHWVLAHSLNGRPMGIGGRGPLWLAYETGTKPATSDEEALWVWSVFYIEVGER